MNFSYGNCEKCKNGFYYNEIRTDCISCDEINSNCLECHNSTLFLTCSSNSFLKNDGTCTSF